jgi:hypothetical protein
MLRVLGLVIIMSAGLAQAEEAGVMLDRPETSHAQAQVKKGFHPLRAIRRTHDGFVNMAIGLSSIGIDQPPDAPMPVVLTSEAPRPACMNLQLTAMLTPDSGPSLPR